MSKGIFWPIRFVLRAFGEGIPYGKSDYFIGHRLQVGSLAPKLLQRDSCGVERIFC